MNNYINILMKVSSSLNVVACELNKHYYRKKVIYMLILLTLLTLKGHHNKSRKFS